MSWIVLVTLSLLYTLGGAPLSLRIENYEVPAQHYGSACHRALQEYRAELSRRGGSLDSFECFERLARQ